MLRRMEKKLSVSGINSGVSSMVVARSPVYVKWYNSLIVLPSLFELFR